MSTTPMIDLLLSDEVRALRSDEVRELRAELAAAKSDADRFRALESRRCVHITAEYWDAEDQWTVTVSNYHDHRVADVVAVASTLREAVDTACAIAPEVT